MWSRSGSRGKTLTVFLGATLISSLFPAPARAAAPTVLNVTSLAANGTYGYGDVIDISIQFSENVTVTGTPTLLMRYSSVLTANINYISGSNTNTLTFRFTGTTATTTADLDYVATNSLSGTIKNSALEQAVLTLPAPGSAGSLSANKEIGFESFGSRVTSTPIFQSTHLYNLVYSSARNSLFTADGQDIVEVDLNLSTKTTFLATGASVNNLAIFGDTLYWSTSSGLYKSSVTNPAKTTLLTHTAAIAAFSRTNDYWVILDSSRGLHKYIDDGSLARTFVSTLSASIADSIINMTSLSTSPNPEKVLLRSTSSGVVTEIDISNGATTTYGSYSKCTTTLRGMVRLGDGSEVYGAYSPTNVLTRRWPDGRVSCTPVGSGPWMYGAAAVTANYLYFSVYGTSSSDYRIWRFTPFNTNWSGAWSQAFTGFMTSSTITQPALAGGGRNVYKGIPIAISVQVSAAGKVSFRANGKNISKCQRVLAISLVATCTWTPAIHGSTKISTTLTPTATNTSTSSSSINFNVIHRTTTR